MAPVTTPPAPGSMTVPLLFGWQHILTAVTVGVIVAVAALVVLAARKDASERSEWQAWLDARSRGHQDPVTDEHDRFTGAVQPPLTDEHDRFTGAVQPPPLVGWRPPVEPRRGHNGSTTSDSPGMPCSTMTGGPPGLGQTR